MDLKWVYLFTELEAVEASMGDWEAVRGLLGGKGANLAEMSRIQVPVPPGFTVTTEACIAYLGAEGGFPADIWEQQIEALGHIEAETGKKFGNPENPLLVSCRSGAKFSMPGMMDTILNLGMNDKVAAGMVELTGDARFVYDSYRRLIQMFGTVVRGMEAEVFEEVLEHSRRAAGVSSDPELGAEDWIAITQRFKELVKIHTRAPFPTKPLEQLQAATEAVFESWNTKRAVRLPERVGNSARHRYRREHPDDGLREYGRDLRDGRCDEPQSIHRRARPTRGLPCERPGGRRGGRNQEDPRHQRDGGAIP